MALPCGTTGSLCSSFLPDRVVSLPVKHPYAITLYDRLPIGLRVPLEASVTLLEATTPVKLPTIQCPRFHELELKQPKGRISTATPPTLACLLRSLLPILYTRDQRPMPSCSEGSRGLSVLPQVARIFTNSAVSPGPWSRQRPSRCAFRAGRNLPDKEFRYLRTVIVTAAVYRGLASGLRLAANSSA